MDKPTIYTPDSNVESTQPPYEAPVVVNLGGMGSEAGQTQLCQAGTSALDCATGATPTALCSTGTAEAA